jgi:hypothetical protein
MKCLGAVVGLLAAGACTGDPVAGDPTTSEGGDALGAEPFAEFRAACGPRDHGGDHGDRAGGRAVRRAIGGAAARIAALQADTLGDNARNGVDDADPDDGGWDFIIAPTATEHSTAASPPNLFGAIGLGAWAAVVSDSAGNRALGAAIDAGAAMQRNPDIDSAPDFVFGAVLAELADNPGFSAIARQHYDAKRAGFGGAAGLGAFIRDARHGSGEDGLIPYDVGWFVLATAALDAAFPGAGYAADADTYAQIVVDDVTAASPDFDLADPGESSYITGLAWVQVSAARLRDRSLLRDVRSRLLDQQRGDGTWGSNAAQPGTDLQATAHALQTLAITARANRAVDRAERRAARWLIDHQAAPGGWVDANNQELPLVDADIALGLVLARTSIDAGDLAPEVLIAGPGGASAARTAGAAKVAAPMP